MAENSAYINLYEKTEKGIMLSAFILPHADAPQARRKAVFLDKLVISAVLDYATLVKHDYAVALLYCGQSVSYHDTGAFQPFKRV